MASGRSRIWSIAGGALLLSSLPASAWPACSGCCTAQDRSLTAGVSEVLFDVGKATLGPEARQKLTQLANVLVAHGAAYTLAVRGHTDSIGSDAVNLRLSRARAQAVRDCLVAGGVPASRAVIVEGLGKSRPVASNATTEGRRRNRRVEIVVVEEFPFADRNS